MVAKPPYSPIFAWGLAALLREPVVSKALRSSDLDAGHRRSLVAFVEAVAPAAKQAPMAEEEEEGVLCVGASPPQNTAQVNLLPRHR